METPKDNGFDDSGENCDIIDGDRAGGTSLGSGNPPANVYSVHVSFQPVVEILKEKGFADAETAECGYLIQRFSYEQLAYYFRPVLAAAEEHEPTVKAVHDVAVFDRRFKSACFRSIGFVESQLRTQYAHWMREEHGEFAIEDGSLFSEAPKYRQTKEEYDQGAKRAMANNSVLKDVSRENGGMMPMGYAVQTMTLGVLSRFYANTMSAEVRGRVAASFGTSPVVLKNWLRAISDVRNICAHFGAYLPRRQMPTTSKRVIGIECDHTAPPYIACILLYLLSEQMPFKDRALDYGSTMLAEFSGVFQEFCELYEHLLPTLGFSVGWLDSLEKAYALGTEAKEPDDRAQGEEEAR